MEEILDELKEIKRMISQGAKPWLTVNETAEYLGCSQAHVYTKVKGIIPHSKFGSKMYFKKEDIDSYLEGLKTKIDEL